MWSMNVKKIQRKNKKKCERHEKKRTQNKNKEQKKSNRSEESHRTTKLLKRETHTHILKHS